MPCVPSSTMRLEGRARAVLIEGEAGIGKTRLLTRSVGRSRKRGVPGSLGRVRRDRAGPPAARLGRSLRSPAQSPDRRARPELAELLRVGGGPPGRPAAVLGAVDGSWVIVESVLNVLEDLASTAPVALAVEDLQWADPLTLAGGALRRPAPAPDAAWCCWRRCARGPMAWTSTGPSPTCSPQARSTWCSDSLDPRRRLTWPARWPVFPPGPGLLEQVGRAGGNPLFVIELVRALGDDGAIEVRDGRAEARSESPPPTLRLTLLRRLSQLPEDGLNLLRIASVLGSTFSVAELALALRTHVGAAATRARRRRWTAGLLSGSGDRLAFHHELVRDALYHDLPVAVRKGLHREAGIALRDAGASVERVAAHVVLGAETGDAEAVAWLRTGR